MPSQPAIFHDSRHRYYADTCLPLKRAAEAGRVSLRAAAHGPYPGAALPAKILPEIRTVGYWDAPGTQDWGLPLHRNEGIELTYLSRGQLAFGVEGEKIPLHRGNLTITRPWQRHRVGNPNVSASRLYWLILDVGVRRPNQAWKWPCWLILSREERRELTTLLRHNEQAVWSADARVARCFEKLDGLLKDENAPPDRTSLAIWTNELLLAVLHMLRGQKIELNEALTSSQRTVELFLEDIPHRIGEPWTVDSMAEQCGLGRTRFVHYCRQIANLSPIHYLARCRIDAARKLLDEQPDLPIIQVALTCGFSSSQYFATVFKSLMGYPPRTMRVKT
jgi:AraC-like DNA-binding protein